MRRMRWGGRSGLGVGVVLVMAAGCGSKSGAPPVDGTAVVVDGGADVESDAGDDGGVVVDAGPSDLPPADAPTDPGAGSPETGDAAADTGATDAGAAMDAGSDVHIPHPDAPGARIWTDDSAEIDVSCIGHHEGAMRFHARREQLSPEQLGLLANVALAGDQTLNDCVPDVLGCTITITGGDAGVATYHVLAFDMVCTRPDNLVSDATFRTFRSNLTCRYSLDNYPGGGVMPPVVPDARCYNGLGYLTNVPEPVLAESNPGTVRHVELDGCSTSATKYALQIFAPGGTTPVAEATAPSDPGADQTCLSLQHTFDGAGPYRLHVSVPGQDAGGTLTPVQLYYRYY